MVHEGGVLLRRKVADALCADVQDNPGGVLVVDFGSDLVASGLGVAH